MQFAKDPEVEGEGVDSPHVHRARGPVSECPDRQKGGSGPAIGGGLHPSKTPSVVPDALSCRYFAAYPRAAEGPDTTLQKVRELTHSSDEGAPGGAVFFYRNGLIFRRWSPKNRDALSWDQLVLPQQCRQLVLNIAHDL